MDAALAMAKEALQGLYTPDGVLKHEVQAGLATLVIATIVYKLSRWFTPLYFRGYKQLSIAEQRDWDSRLGTIVYSAYIVSVAVRLLLIDSEQFFWKEGPVPHVLRTNELSREALAVSTGFFLYELIITVKHLMGGVPMIIHHLGSFTCVVTAYMTGYGHMYTIWMLSTELTTPFIAMRYLLDKAGLKAHPAYGINGIFILLGWCVARLATFPPFFLTVYKYKHELVYVNLLAKLLIVVFPVILFSLNSFWFTKIAQGAYKHFFGKPKQKAA